MHFRMRMLKNNTTFVKKQHLSLQKEISVHVEDRYVRIINHLSVAQCGCTPHDEWLVQPPLAVHDVKQAVRVLALDWNHARRLINVFVGVVGEQMVDSHQREPIARDKQKRQGAVCTSHHAQLILHISVRRLQTVKHRLLIYFVRLPRSLNRSWWSIEIQVVTLYQMTQRASLTLLITHYSGSMLLAPTQPLTMHPRLRTRPRTRSARPRRKRLNGMGHSLRPMGSPLGSPTLPITPK